MRVITALLSVCKVYEHMGPPLLYKLEQGLLESKGIKVELAFAKPARICCRHSEAALQRIPDLLTLLGLLGL